MIKNIIKKIFQKHKLQNIQFEYQDYISQFKDKLVIYSINPLDNIRFNECEALFESARQQNPLDQDVIEFPDLAIKYFEEVFPLIHETGYEEIQQKKIEYYKNIKINRS